MGVCFSRSGAYSAASISAGTSSNRRAKVDWLPRADEVWIDPKTGRPSRRFYQFLREMAENRMGGINGQTVPQVANAASAASATAATVGVFANTVLTYAEGINTTVEATVQVAVDNSLTGSGDIPPGPVRPPSFEP